MRRLQAGLGCRLRQPRGPWYRRHSPGGPGRRPPHGGRKPAGPGSLSTKPRLPGPTGLWRAPAHRLPAVLLPHPGWAGLITRQPPSSPAGALAGGPGPRPAPRLRACWRHWPASCWRAPLTAPLDGRALPPALGPAAAVSAPAGLPKPLKLAGWAGGVMQESLPGALGGQPLCSPRRLAP